MEIGITNTKTIDELCQFCEDAQADIRKGFALLLTAEERLKKIVDSPNILPRDTWQDLADVHEESHKIVRKQVWRRLLELSEIFSICSVEERNRIDKEFEENNLPQISPENVRGWLEALRNRIPDMFDAAIKEVFEFLRPGKWCSHKTNSKFEIGPKVIIDYGMDTSYGMCHPSYHKTKFYQALDNVFHLLDGKGVSKYPDNFITKLEQVSRQTKWKLVSTTMLETEYFSCKWYKRGTLHISFKRLDLLKELNKRAGGYRIKGNVA